ncbi:MAG: NADH-quinone oxidoreductase subunit M [Dehalococcoidia bacterium]
MLTAIVFLPAVGGAVIALLARNDRQVRYMALAVTLAVLVLSLIVWATIDLGERDPQWVQRYQWISAFNVQYFLGVDGLSAPLLGLTGLLGVAAVLVSWGVKQRAREFFFWLLILQTGITGVFVSLDLLLFFLFWEVELIPMYLLISIWGSGRKEYSAMKFLLYTMGSSALMLTAILVLFFSAGTFDMIELRDTPFTTVLITAPGVFFLLLAAFAVKLPVWPFHTWLPDAHTDAPTAASVMLAGVMLKMGGYGIFRLCISFFPQVARDYSDLIVGLAVVNILYGAVMVFRQRDLKRLIAYSSISHMGFVLLGVAAMNQVGLTGAAMQMFTHGTITGLLFIVAGLVYEKAHTRHIPDLGGLAARMPVLTIGFMIAGLAALGLPSMSGFVSEILVFFGAYEVYRTPTILAIFGVLLSAGYILWTAQQVFFGPEKPRFATIGDVSLIEAAPLAGMIAAIMIVGIYPAFVTDFFNAGIAPLVDLLGAGGG